jgi:hypothetical protein
MTTLTDYTHHTIQHLAIEISKLEEEKSCLDLEKAHCYPQSNTHKILDDECGEIAKLLGELRELKKKKESEIVIHRNKNFVNTWRNK